MLGPEALGRPAAEVARRLLGCTLCVGDARGRIVETEAYVGPHDLACHARAGITGRTRVLYGPPGRAYVYLVYGMHDMFNVVTGADGDGEAVLVRAVEPLVGLQGRTDGPGRLCRAYGISVASHNGRPLDRPEFCIEAGPAPATVQTTPRIGVGFAGSWATAPLRFIDPQSKHLSRRAPVP